MGSGWNRGERLQARHLENIGSIMEYFRSQMSALPSQHKKFNEPGKVQLPQQEFCNTLRVEVTEGKKKHFSYRLSGLVINSRVKGIETFTIEQRSGTGDDYSSYRVLDLMRNKVS